MVYVQQDAVDKNRPGRHNCRLIEIVDAAGHLGPDGKGLINTAVRVTSHSWRKDAKAGLWQLPRESAFYASQISLDAASIGQAIC